MKVNSHPCNLKLATPPVDVPPDDAAEKRFAPIHFDRETTAGVTPTLSQQLLSLDVAVQPEKKHTPAYLYIYYTNHLHILYVPVKGSLQSKYNLLLPLQF